MSEIVPIVPNSSMKSGNTKIQISPSIRWCFTLNNYTSSDIDTLVIKLTNVAKKWVFEEEQGNSGTPHLQGYVEFKTKIRPLSLNLNNKIHWEKAKKDADTNYSYCTKDNGNIRQFGFPKPLKLLKEEQLYNWQREIISIIKSEPDDRTIHWYWEPKGKIGKTTFCKYLCALFKAVPLEGKKNDILYCASMNESNVYIIDLERTMSEFVPYGAIEKIKNGLYMVGKYESTTILRNSPHVFIFANFQPDTSKLSDDRWHIVDLSCHL